MKKSLGGIVFLGIVSAVYFLTQAGNLDPPGPPDSTMVTLEEIEPGTPIHASDLPLTITEAGRYFLAENITTAGGGIVVSTDNVTIDLKGCKLTGGTGQGISSDPAFENIRVMNGTVTDWSQGVWLPGMHSTVSDLTVRSCGSFGIYLGYAGSVDRVYVDDCTSNGVGVGDKGRIRDSLVFGGSYGSAISAGNQSRVIDCIAHFGIYNISVGSGSLVSGCVGVTGDQGIVAQHSSSVIDCVVETTVMDYAIHVAEKCTVSRCTVGGGHAGIRAGDGSTVSHNTAAVTGPSGINVVNYCLVIDNNVSGGSEGIHVSGDGNRIERNHAHSSQSGIKVYGIGNTIVKNTAHNNVLANYEIAAGNDVGPIGSAAASKSPWANLEN